MASRMGSPNSNHSIVLGRIALCIQQCNLPNHLCVHVGVQLYFHYYAMITQLIVATSHSIYWVAPRSQFDYPLNSPAVWMETWKNMANIPKLQGQHHPK